MIAGIFTAFKALGFLKAASGALSFIPGVGVLPGIFSAVLKAIFGFCKLLFDGVTVIVSNPAALVTVFVISLTGMAYGFKTGSDWTGHRVDTLRAQHTMALRRIVTDAEAAVAGKKLAAADAVKTAPQPETPAEIVALCQKSASCRERAR